MALTNILVSTLMITQINTMYWKLTQARLEPNVASNHYATTLMEISFHLSRQYFLSLSTKCGTNPPQITIDWWK